MGTDPPIDPSISKPTLGVDELPTIADNNPASPRTVGADDAVVSANATPLPTRIGSYRILRLLGEGGMGAVYEAEQPNPRRRVALKVVRPALLTRHLLRRLELEADVLGRLEHPGIARIYEAGTVDVGDAGVPQPFFAMELVDGVPLTTYARSHKLNTSSRLALLAKVCDAVHHAHQKASSTAI